MKKVILLSAVLITGIPISCDWGQTGSSIFRIEELGISVGLFENNIFQEREFEPAPMDTLSSSDLVIEIRIEDVSLVAESGGNWFIPSAFAEQIIPKAEDRLSLISIYAEEPIFADGTEYKAGDNLASLFSISSLYYASQSSILKFIHEFDTWYSDDRLYIVLSTPIDKSLAQSLKLDFTFENGKIIPLNTKKIVVK